MFSAGKKAKGKSISSSKFARLTEDGKQVCWAWNQGGCNFSSCEKAHVCAAQKPDGTACGGNRKCGVGAKDCKGSN